MKILQAAGAGLFLGIALVFAGGWFFGGFHRSAWEAASLSLLLSIAFSVVPRDD